LQIPKDRHQMHYMKVKVWGTLLSQWQPRRVPRTARSVAIFRETRNGVRPISGAKNQATAIAFGGPRSSCVRPGAHSARRQDSRNDLTPCRVALHFVSAGAHAPHSDETPGPTATRGSSHSARRLRSLAFHVLPRCLAQYDIQDQSIPLQLQVVAQVRCSIQSG